MKLPTLRQVSGFAMIVNTFLPAIVVVTLGLMTWSTVAAIKHNACAAVSYLPRAMNDDREMRIYVGASGDARRSSLQGFVRRLHELPPPAGGPCGSWRDLRARITGIVTDEIYGETVERIEHEVKEVERKYQRVRTEVQRAIPSIPPIKRPGIPGLDEAVSAVNQLFRIVRSALDDLGAALARLGRGVTEPIDTAGEKVREEFQKADYKRAVAWELLDRFWSDTADLFDKFWWFFVLLALWLTSSYALWVHRRLAVGWTLMCNREAV